MELREKIAGMIFDAPLNPSDKACHAIADEILALPEIAEALAIASETTEAERKRKLAWAAQVQSLKQP